MAEESNEGTAPMSEEEIDGVLDAMEHAIQREIERVTSPVASNAEGISGHRFSIEDFNRAAEAVEQQSHVPPAEPPSENTGENRPTPWRPYTMADVGHTMDFNNGSTIRIDGAGVHAHTIRGGTFATINTPRNEWQQPNIRMNEHFDDVMVNYLVPEKYADHVTGAVKILSDLSVSACSVSHIVVPGQIYIEFTLLKHRVHTENSGLIVGDIQKWHAFLSYMYAIQKGYEPLLWDDALSISDQRFVVKNDYKGAKGYFGNLKRFYEARGYKWQVEEVQKKRDRTYSRGRRHYLDTTFSNISIVEAYSFLNIYDLLETTEDRAEFATICGLFAGKKHGDMTNNGSYFYELATGKGTDIETHHFVVVKERRGKDVENMFFRRLSPARRINFDLSDKHKERWEEKTRKMSSTNTQKEQQLVVNRAASFKGMRYANV